MNINRNIFYIDFKGSKQTSSSIYFENLFNENDIDWAVIYMLPRLITYNNYMRAFQYKILDNTLFLNKKLHIFEIKSSPLFSFCNSYDGTPFHIFYECDRVKYLCSDLVQCFQNTLVLPTLISQTAILGILDSVSNNSFYENNKIFPSRHTTSFQRLYDVYTTSL